MATNWPPFNFGSGGDDIKTSFQNVESRLDSLFSGFASNSAPAAVTNGLQWYDDTTPATPVIKHYVDGSFLEYLMPYVLRGNADFDDNQALNFRLENLAAKPVSTPTTDGRIGYVTTDGRAFLDASTVHGDTVWLHAGDVSDVRWLPITSNMLGSSAPTATSVGSSPAVPGYVFDDTSKSIIVSDVIPDDWEAGSDLFVRTLWALASSETTNDDIELTMDYVVATPNNNEALNKTSANVTVSLDIGTNTSQFSVHEVDITIDFDLAGNLVSVGDFFSGEIHLTATTDISSLILVGVGLGYVRNN